MNTGNRSDQPTLRSDATVVRPRGNTKPAVADDATWVGALRSTSMRPPSPLQPAAPTALRAELGDFLSGAPNPLVRAANPLLLLALQLRHSVAPPVDIGRLREQAVAQVHSFERYAQGAGLNTQTIMAARYVLCTMLDESVNNAPWGDQSGWAQKTLLVTFHGETYGGAKFFQILERLSADFSRHLDLIELMYICLARGFRRPLSCRARRACASHGYPGRPLPPHPRAARSASHGAGAALARYRRPS